MNMLRYFFVCLSVSIGPHLIAQDFDPLKHKLFEGGLTLGANITQVDGDTYSGFHKVGIQAGGLVYVHLNEKWGVSMEMLYAQKGSRGGNVKESVALGTYVDKYYLNLNYIEIPLMLHYNRFVYFDFEAGVSYARLLRSKEWAEADVPLVVKPEYNSFNSSDFNYIGGVTVRLSKHWYGSIRYQYSVSPIRKWDRVPLRYSQYNVDEYNNIVVIRALFML
jgi:opacity protein-like surface antigen